MSTSHKGSRHKAERSSIVLKSRFICLCKKSGGPNYLT